MLLKKRWIRPYAPGYDPSIHNGLERHGFVRDNRWPVPGTRMYRRATGEKVLVSGEGYGMKLIWTFFSIDELPNKKFDTSGLGLYRLTRLLDKTFA